MKIGTILVDNYGQDCVYLGKKYKLFDVLVSPENSDYAYRDSKEKYVFEKTKRKPYTVVKSTIDGYPAAAVMRGKKMMISVGCRIFTSLKEAKKHWSNKEDGEHYGNIQEAKDNLSRGYDPEWGEQRERDNIKRLAGTIRLVKKLKEKHNAAH